MRQLGLVEQLHIGAAVLANSPAPPLPATCPSYRSGEEVQDRIGEIAGAAGG